MKLFVNIFFFYFKQLYKDILYIGTMLFFIIMLLFRFYFEINEHYDYMDYGNFIVKMTIIVQAGMLLFMVFFYKIFSDEYKFGAKNLFIGNLQVTLLKITALLCNHLIALAIVIGMMISFIYLYFYASGIPVSYFYGQTASYLIVYWYLPFVFAFFIGILTALVFGKNKISFVFLIIMWLAFGPVNTELFSRYFHKIPFSDIKSLFYIGPLSINTAYQELVGYNISQSTYVKIIFWIILTLLLLLLVLIKSARTGREKGWLMAASICLVIVNAAIFPKIFDSGKLVFSYADVDAESSYYKNYSYDVKPSYLNYTIKDYTIKINVDQEVKAEAKVALTNIENDSLSFVLYRFFKVTKITNTAGENLPFIQDGDFVLLEEVFKERSEEVLTFYYDMNDSTKLPVSTSYLFLPNYFSWVPTKADHAPLKFNEGNNENTIFLPSQSKNLVKYTLSINSRLPIYTNLKKDKQGKFSGVVSGGITVISGMATSEQFGNFDVIYPNSWSDISSDWPIFEEYLVKVHNKVTDIFQIKNMELPNKVILLSPNSQRKAYISSDHILFQNDNPLNISSSVKEIPEVYIPALIWNYDTRKFKSYEQIEAFNQILAYYIRDEIGIKSPVSAPSTAEPPFVAFYKHNKETQNKITQFYEEFYHLNNQQKKEFLILWYREMHNVSESWLKTIELFQKFKENS